MKLFLSFPQGLASLSSQRPAPFILVAACNANFKKELRLNAASRE
jgi:hypothetical protein